MIQNIYFLIDANTKMWTEITDLVVFRKKLLKFLQGALDSREWLQLIEASLDSNIGHINHMNM